MLSLQPFKLLTTERNRIGGVHSAVARSNLALQRGRHDEPHLWSLEYLGPHAGAAITVGPEPNRFDDGAAEGAGRFPLKPLAHAFLAKHVPAG